MEKDFKFRVGDKVKTDLGFRIYEITSVVVNKCNPDKEVYTINNIIGYYQAHELTLIERPFTLDDLEVGMLVEFRYGEIGIVLPQLNSECKGFLLVTETGFMDTNSYVSFKKGDDYSRSFDIVKVYGKPSGYTQGLFNSKNLHRPILWEEKEELFTLQCPITGDYFAKTNKGHLTRLHKNDLEAERNNRFEQQEKLDSINFTQKEIDELPNQEFIKSMKQEPVKENK